MNSEAQSTTARTVWIIPGILAAVVAALWIFPALWYTKHPDGGIYWFGEKRAVPGWDFREMPVDQVAEKLLVADRTFNGEFTRSNEPPVYVFSARRYEEKSNEIGLFVHTPDRCWVETGWKIEPSVPDVREINLHGVRVPVERRIFDAPGRRELVYFFGLVAGQPLPYRLDHNLSVGLRSSKAQPKSGAALRVTDRHFWARLWDSFASRREFTGPKQFVRVSTPVPDGEVSRADAHLENFLEQWLAPVDYNSDRAAWKLSAQNANSAKAVKPAERRD